jgi:hypothetical protein
MSRFLIRLMLFLVIVVSLQLIVGHKVPSEIKRIDRAVSGNMDIVFFCDSTNFAYSVQDTDRRSISEMLQDKVPDRQIITIDHGALNMDMYLAFCRYIRRSGGRPNAVILCLNMRSFSPVWDRRPNWQFEKERFLLNHPLLRPFYKPLGVFKAISANEISMEQYNATKVYCDEDAVGTVQEFEFIGLDPNTATEEHVRKTIILQYMYPLKPDHRKLRSMLEIVETLRSIGARPVFYMTPLDIETGQRYLPGRFRERIHANIECVTTLLRSRNVEPLDLSTCLPASDFAWTRFPNEHLNQHGRSRVADYLAETVQNHEGR